MRGKIDKNRPVKCDSCVGEGKVKRYINHSDNSLYNPIEDPHKNRIRNVLCAIKNVRTQCGDKFLAIVEDCESWEAYLMAELKRGGK